MVCAAGCAAQGAASKSTEAGKLRSHQRSDGFWPLLGKLATPESWAELDDEEARSVEAMLEALQASD